MLPLNLVNQDIGSNGHKLARVLCLSTPTPIRKGGEAIGSRDEAFGQPQRGRWIPLGQIFSDPREVAVGG